MAIARGSQELDLLRSDLETWFTDTCDIYRVTSTDDVYGGRTRDHGGTPTHAGVPCTIESGAGQDQERLFLGEIREIQLFTVTLPAGTDVEVGDHLVVHSAQTLHVHVRAVMAPETLDVEMRVIATQVDQESVGP